MVFWLGKKQKAGKIQLKEEDKKAGKKSLSNYQFSMLNKKKRVTSSLFKSTLRKGVNYFSPNISLKIVKIWDANLKFAVSISKKELKTAAKRNLLKRRVLSILRDVEPKVNLGFICLFFLKKEALDLPYQKLQDEIVFLLKKAKIYSQ